MSEIKSGPYEILLRYNCEPGETFGQLRGCHRVMKSYVVDDDGKIAGRIEGGAADHAQAFPAGEVEKLLGSQFVAFADQLETARSELEAAQAAHSDEKADLIAQIAAKEQELARVKPKL